MLEGLSSFFINEGVRRVNTPYKVVHFMWEGGFI